MTYVKINGAQYPASISGRMSDSDWDGRESKSITLEMTHDEALAVWTEGAAWSIVQDITSTVMVTDEQGNPVLDENGQPTFREETRTEEYDNSEFNVAGDVTDHRNGTVTVKMGKLTELEETLEIFLG